MLVLRLLFGLLVAEAVLVAFISAPLVPTGLKRLLLRLLRGLVSQPWVRALMVIIFLLVAFQAYDNFGEAQKLGYRKDKLMETGHGHTPETTNRMFRAQRNFYLAGMTDFLMFILYGYAHHFKQIEQLENELKARRSE
eukprot:TRINITY_DN16820_c0_g1_i1.p2 TRINITY_DN16820_c0_g1~~TRINITY_DN16820_c0_g1_i1.p2  ORF type:complete len:156 (-),score=47.41 TRINITY_DN16820_c0_g1_i1:81-494(-)